MAFPEGADTIVLTVRTGQANGAADRTPITLTPSPAQVVSTALDDIRTNEPITVTPDRGTGAGSVRLLCTDADGYNPTGWTYRVDSDGASPYYVQLPKALGATVDLTDLVPVSEDPGTYDLLIRAADLPTASTDTAGLVRLEGDLAAVQPAGATTAAGATGLAADAGHAHTVQTLLPVDNGMVWWSFPPINAGGANVPSAANVPGKLTLQRVVLRHSTAVSKIWLGVSANDAGATLTNCYLGLYDATGTLLAQTADVSSSLKVSAAYGFTLTPGVTLPAGEYFIALLMGQGSTWTTWNLKSSLGGVTANAGLVVPHLNLANVGSGLTALPATVSLASMTTSLITGGWGSQWYGLSA